MNSPLKIAPEFKRLIRPISRKEYHQLEESLVESGCVNPIFIWNNIIVDGHNRYEICNRLGIKYQTKELSFDCREAVISWICSNQLRRPNIPEETRKFLIGMQYESEKVVGSKRSLRGINQYNKNDMPVDGSPHIPGNYDADFSHKTAKHIADENHISIATVQKYAIFTRSLEEIGKKEPALVPKILSGQYKISHRNVLDLAKMPVEDVKKFNRKIERDPTPFIQYKKTRNAVQTGRYECIPESPELQGPSVKDMPEYDPDAEISSLALTIPSWKSSIERAKAHTNLSAITSEGRKRTLEALFKLKFAVDDMIITLEEEKWKI